MKGCTAGPLTLVVVWLSFCIATGSCAGQDPGSLAANPSQGSLPTSGPASPSLPVLDSLSTKDSRKITSLPPSSVSPEIESFMRRNGGKLASPKASEFTRSLPAIDSRPLPPPSLPPSTPTRVDRVMRPISRQVPSSLPPPTPGTRGPGGRLLTMGPSPLSLALQLKPAPHEPTDLNFPINLATALRLADARPLIVAAAQASVWVAEAQLTRAKVLWVPSVIMGVDYIRHDGGGPDINKGVMTAASVNFFYAGPGLWQYVNLTDVIFEPLAARQSLNSAHWDVQTAKNDALLQTADAYFLVHQYRGVYAGALYCVEKGHDLVDRIANLTREFIPAVEVDRARNFLADLEQRAVLARQEWRVTSANLTQVLRLDPRAVVEPLEHDHTQLTLVDPGKTLEELMPIALTNRPELGSRRALVQAAEIRVRREKARPLLPLIMLNGFQSAGMFIQGGLFALGPNSSMNQWVGRDDTTIQLMWQLESFGFGNLARIKNQRGSESRAILDLLHTQDRVAADVTRTLARVQSAAARVLQADQALRTGIVAFQWPPRRPGADQAT